MTSSDPVRTLAEVTAVARAVLNHQPAVEHAKSVGCAFPGALDAEGRVSAWPNRPAWVGTLLRDTIARSTGCRDVDIRDDGFCAAIGEYRLGVARHRGDHLTLVLGTGIGGAWTIAGQVRRPRAALARTIGHLRALADDRPCSCGQRGCLQLALADLPLEPAAPLVWPSGRRLVEVVADVANSLGVDTAVLTGGRLGTPWVRDFLATEFTRLNVECLIPGEVRHSSLLGAVVRDSEGEQPYN